MVILYVTKEILLSNVILGGDIRPPEHLKQKKKEKTKQNQKKTDFILNLKR